MKKPWESTYPLINNEPLEYQITIDATNCRQEKDDMVKWCFGTFGKKRFHCNKIEVENTFDADIVLDSEVKNTTPFQVGSSMNISRIQALFNFSYFGNPNYKIPIYIFSFKRKSDMILFKLRWA